MTFVCILESADHRHWYVGITNDVDRRIAEHSAGHTTHTNKFWPWILKSYIAFQDLPRAGAFERYLKSHAGRAFAKKHL